MPGTEAIRWLHTIQHANVTNIHTTPQLGHHPAAWPTPHPGLPAPLPLCPPAEAILLGLDFEEALLDPEQVPIQTSQQVGPRCC